MKFEEGQFTSSIKGGDPSEWHFGVTTGGGDPLAKTARGDIMGRGVPFPTNPKKTFYCFMSNEVRHLLL